MSRSLVLTQDEIEFKDGDNILNTIFCASDGTMIISASDNGASTVVRGDLEVSGNLTMNEIIATNTDTGTFGDVNLSKYLNLYLAPYISSTHRGIVLNRHTVDEQNSNITDFASIVFYDNPENHDPNSEFSYQASYQSLWINKAKLKDCTVDGASVTSDDRLKHNETTISDALSTLNQLQPMSYYKTTEFYEHNKVFASDEIPSDARYESGFIAQEVRQIPELAYLVSGEETNSNGENTPLALSYNDLHAFSVKAIQELHALVQSQQTTIADLTTRLEALESSS